MIIEELEKLRDSIASCNEFQIYLHALVFLQFALIGFCIGYIFMANQVVMDAGANPAWVEHKVREITAICTMLYVSLVLSMLAVDSKLS